MNPAQADWAGEIFQPQITSNLLKACVNSILIKLI